MEMQWCLIALKPLCHFLLFGMYVLLLDDYVASEMHLVEISRCNNGRMCNNSNK